MNVTASPITLNTLFPEAIWPGQVPATITDTQVDSITLDSRHVTQGALFVAVPGTREDGRAYIEHAVKAGARAVLLQSDTPFAELRDGVVRLAVKDVKIWLGDIADRFYRHASQHVCVIGVTGTNGKTSSAWFIRDALAALGQPCGLIGTLGATFQGAHCETGHTTPDIFSVHGLIAWMAQQGAQAVSMEVSSHALDQGRVDQVAFSVAVFTNLSRDHLDYHSSMESYFNAKAKLFQTGSVTHAVINQDDEYGRILMTRIAHEKNVITFSSENRSADVYAEHVQCSRQGVQASLQVRGEKIDIRVPLYGRFNLANLMACAGVMLALGQPVSHIKTALEQVTAVPGRMQPAHLPTADSTQLPVVLIDYAHTPDALDKALSAVRDHFSSDIACVLGAGGERDQGKRPHMGAVADTYAGQIYITSDNPRNEDPAVIARQILSGVAHAGKAHIQLDRQRAVQEAVSGVSEQGVVLIAGKGHEQYQQVGDKRIPMNDMELARLALAHRAGGAA